MMDHLSFCFLVPPEDILSNDLGDGRNFSNALETIFNRPIIGADVQDPSQGRELLQHPSLQQDQDQQWDYVPRSEYMVSGLGHALCWLKYPF
jgi:hypothetical protein